MFLNISVSIFHFSPHLCKIAQENATEQTLAAANTEVHRSPVMLMTLHHGLWATPPRTHCSGPATPQRTQGKTQADRKS